MSIWKYLWDCDRIIQLRQHVDVAIVCASFISLLPYQRMCGVIYNGMRRMWYVVCVVCLCSLLRICVVCVCCWCVHVVLMEAAYFKVCPFGWKGPIDATEAAYDVAIVCASFVSLLAYQRM